MTRINLVEPSRMATRHLVAEYKELTQVLRPLKLSLAKAGSVEALLETIPSKYTLNGGHVKFWYDKGEWMLERFDALYIECCTRGVNVDHEGYQARRRRIIEEYPADLFLPWMHDEEELAINETRILERISEKPHLYPDAWRMEGV